MNYEIKGIIFDLGKVVFDYSFNKAYTVWANATNLTIAEIKKKHIFDDNFEKYESGFISTLDFYKSLNKKLGLKMDYECFKHGWTNIYLDKFEGIDELLAKLKRRYRLVALTNTNELHKTIWITKYKSTLSNFENIFCSHEIKCRKPDLNAFNYALVYLKAKPHQVFFFDDNEQNINAAESLGLNTILVKNIKQMSIELINMGIITK